MASKQQEEGEEIVYKPNCPMFGLQKPVCLQKQIPGSEFKSPFSDITMGNGNMQLELTKRDTKDTLYFRTVKDKVKTWRLRCLITHVPVQIPTRAGTIMDNLREISRREQNSGGSYRNNRNTPT